MRTFWQKCTAALYKFYFEAKLTLSGHRHLYHHVLTLYKLDESDSASQLIEIEKLEMKINSIRKYIYNRNQSYNKCFKNGDKAFRDAEIMIKEIEVRNKILGERVNKLEGKHYQVDVDNMPKVLKQHFEDYMNRLKSEYIGLEITHKFTKRIASLETRITELETGTHGSGQNPSGSISTHKEERTRVV